MGLKVSKINKAKENVITPSNVGLKTSKHSRKIIKAEENAIDFPLINELLPVEMLEKILEWLDIKSLVNARLTCKHWKLIIDNYNIMGEALSKILMSNKLKDFAGSKNIHVFLIYRKDLLYNNRRRCKTAKNGSW